MTQDVCCCQGHIPAPRRVPGGGPAGAEVLPPVPGDPGRGHPLQVLYCNVLYCTVLHCIVLYTLCSTDGLPNGRSLTIPAFSNICRSADHPDLLPLSCVDNLYIIFSAICHNMPEEDMKLCPYKGKVLSQNPFQAGSQVYLV